MKLYEWQSLESFNNWHTDLCTKLGYPKYGVNQETGAIDTDTEPTRNYTSAWVVDGKAIAFVGDEYNEGLILTKLEPPKPFREQSL